MKCILYENDICLVETGEAGCIASRALVKSYLLIVDARCPGELFVLHRRFADPEHGNEVGADWWIDTQNKAEPRMDGLCVSGEKKRELGPPAPSQLGGSLLAGLSAASFKGASLNPSVWLSLRLRMCVLLLSSWEGAYSAPGALKKTSDGDRVFGSKRLIR